MTPYLAPCLAVLRAEINQRWPQRDHTSDGWIGDTAHQARPSDHNPNARGSVDAIDVDEDGIDFGVVFAAIKRHPSARYVIYERKLYHRLRGWKPETYTGTNPHDKHFHLSIDQTREAEQNKQPWGLLEDDMPLTGDDALTLWSTNAGSAKTPVRALDRLNQIHTQVVALRSVVEQLAAVIKAGGGDVDTAGILRGVDAVVRDAVADLAEGGAAHVRTQQAG